MKESAEQRTSVEERNLERETGRANETPSHDFLFYQACVHLSYTVGLCVTLGDNETVNMASSNGFCSPGSVDLAPFSVLLWPPVKQRL